MKQSQYLTKNESKKTCYIMVGNQIKYDPAWVNSVPESRYMQSQSYKQGKSTSQKKRLEAFGVADSTKSFT